MERESVSNPEEIQASVVDATADEAASYALFHAMGYDEGVSGSEARLLDHVASLGTGGDVLRLSAGSGGDAVASSSSSGGLALQGHLSSTQVRRLLAWKQVYQAACSRGSTALRLACADAVFACVPDASQESEWLADVLESKVAPPEAVSPHVPPSPSQPGGPTTECGHCATTRARLGAAQGDLAAAQAAMDALQGRLKALAGKVSRERLRRSKDQQQYVAVVEELKRRLAADQPPAVDAGVQAVVVEDPAETELARREEHLCQLLTANCRHFLEQEARLRRVIRHLAAKAGAGA